jgi:hypothetical protein
VDDPAPVRVAQRLREGARDLARLVGGEAAHAGEPRAEILAAAQLHHQKGEAVRLAGLEDVDDVGVREAARDLPLAQQAPVELPIAGKLGQQALERDRRAGGRVARAPDLGDAAAAEPFDELEAPGVGQVASSSRSAASSAAASRSATPVIWLARP